MSTLSRGDEIERDYYILKAQEWACEPHEAEEKIKEALVCVRAEFILRRYPKFTAEELTKLTRKALTQAHE